MLQERDNIAQVVVSAGQMIKGFVCLVLILFPACGLQGTDTYSEYWQKFFWNMWEDEAFALGTYIKIDTGNHFKKIRSFQLNEQFLWKASKHFFLECHYAYLHGRSIVPHSPWRWQYRIELEANPIFHLRCNYRIQTRNRLEIRRVQTEPKILYRLRQRTMLIIPFENHNILKSYSLYNELFYNVSTHLFTQNRTCPCQLTFALTDKIALDTFFLIRVFLTDNIWQKSAVFGTQINF